MPTAAAPPPTPSPARERILLTAHDLFYRDGLRATGIDRIIAESGVAKLTFYRHFPSKNDLVLAFLAYRHGRWMAWFTDALARHGAASGQGLQALTPALREWFADPGYRGCAFLNSVGEMGGSLPAVVDVARSHKQDMTAAIEALLPPGGERAMAAQMLAQAVDGAILRAQFDAAEAALAPLEALVGLVALVQRSEGPP